MKFMSQLKDVLIKEGIVKIRNNNEKPFILNELGTKSRIFFDIKQASLNPGILNIIWWNIKRKLMDNKFISEYDILVFDKIASVALGAVPIGTILSYELSVPQIIVCSERHDRGTQSHIIGKCKDEKVMLVEDVSVTGNAIIKSVRVIREAGGICNTAIVVIDREEGAERNCLDNEINLYPLLMKSDFGITENI